MHGIDLFVSLHVTFDGRRRSLYNLLEEVVYLVVGAACEEQSCSHDGRQKPYVFMLFHIFSVI